MIRFQDSIDVDHLHSRHKTQNVRVDIQGRFRLPFEKLLQQFVGRGMVEMVRQAVFLSRKNRKLPMTILLSMYALKIQKLFLLDNFQLANLLQR